jgi:hypothetical protein
MTITMYISLSLQFIRPISSMSFALTPISASSCCLTYMTCWPMANPIANTQQIVKQKIIPKKGSLSTSTVQYYICFILTLYLVVEVESVIKSSPVLIFGRSLLYYFFVLVFAPQKHTHGTKSTTVVRHRRETKKKEGMYDVTTKK